MMITLRWIQRSILVLALIPSAAFADILFLDLNNNPKEIEAAQRAAVKRGEKLIVIPTVTAKQKADLKRAELALKQAQDESKKVCGNYGSPECKAMRTKMDAISAEIFNLKPDLDEISLTKSLKELNQQKVQLSSVVVSGHDGSGHFSGTQGDLSDASIKDAFAKAAPLGDSVRSLILWGCYTTTVGSLEFNWKKVLPNVSMIAGWELKGLLGSDPANWNYLEDVLTKEKALTAAGDDKALQKIFKGIRYVNDSKHRSAVCVNNETIVSPQGVTTISKEIEKCSRLKSGEITEKLQCYEKASPGCEDIPKDTSGGPLRSLYNEVQRTSHCKDFVPSSLQLPSADRTVRLIFDREVRKNFENVNREGLNELNNLLKETHAPEDLQLRNLDKLTRKQYLDKIAGIERWIDQKSGPMKDEFGRFDDPQLLALKVALAPMKELSEIKDRCIPFSWVEPGSRQKDNCSWGETMMESRKQGNLFSAYIMIEREDENAKFKTAGASLKQAYLRREELRLQIDKMYQTNALVGDITRARDNQQKIDDEIRKIESQTLPKIANERIQYYEEKLKKSPTLSEEIRSTYQLKLAAWNRIKSNTQNGR